MATAEMPRREVQLMRLVALLGRGARRLAVDGALGGRRRFPRRITDVDTAWLSDIMGRRVRSVAVVDSESGTSTRARLELTGDDVPNRVFVKLAAAKAGIRMLGEMARLGETESRFYSEVAPLLARGIPRSFGTAFDPLTGRYAVVLEDMSLTDSVFPDTLHPLDRDQMAQLIEVFAHLHGTLWRHLPEKARPGAKLGWLWTVSDDPSSVQTPAILRLSARRLADKTDIPVFRGRFIWQNYASATRAIDAGPHTVLHGDCHPGNTFFRDGRAGLLDWQVVRRGHPARDLAYGMVLGMPTDERRLAERELIDHYRAALVAEGGPELNADDLWRRYRQAVVHPYVAALATAGLGGMQAQAIALEGLRRVVAALEDLDTEGALRPGP